MATGDPVPNAFQQTLAEALVPNARFFDIADRLQLHLNLAFMALPTDQLALLLMQAQPCVIEFASGFEGKALEFGIDLLCDPRFHLINARKCLGIAEPRIDLFGFDIGPAGNRIDFTQMVDGDKAPTITTCEVIAPRFHRLRERLS